MSVQQDSTRKTSSASGSTPSSGASPKKRGPKSTVHEECRTYPERTCEKCKTKLRNVGYQAKHRANNPAPRKPTDGHECQQCAEHKDEIAALQAEVDRLLAGLCDKCYDKLHPNLDDVAGGEVVVSAPVVNVCEASEAVHAATTAATASHMSSQQGTSAAAYALPTGAFGSSVVQHASMVPSSAVSDYTTLSEVYQLQELCRHKGHIAHILQHAIVLTVENPQPHALVRIHAAIGLDGLFVDAFYTGRMFRVLESFYRFALYLPSMPDYAYLRYVKPSNIVLLHDSFPKKAYYSKLSKNYYGHFESQQLHVISHHHHTAMRPPAIPSADSPFVAPEVANGLPFDVNKAVAYSIGASLYDMLTVTMGMKHVATPDGLHFIVEGTFIRHPDGSASGGLYSVNPAIINVIWSLLRPDPALRGTLYDFTRLFTPTSFGQMDTTITGAKPVEPNMHTDDVRWLPASTSTTVSHSGSSITV